MVSTAAGHGTARIAAGRQLLRLLPRLARERADLQPGERGLEGRLRAPLRRAHPGRPRQVAPERARHLAARRAARHVAIVQPASVGGDARAGALGGRGRGRRTSRCGSRSGPRRAGSSCPEGYRPEVGRGTVLREGGDAVLLAYGPVMLHEALARRRAARRSEGLALRVVEMPWLNRFDADWLAAEVAPFEHVFVLEDHAPVGALGRRAPARARRARGRRSSASRAGPRAGRRTRRSASTGSTAPRSRTRIAARVGVRSAR